MKLANSRIPDLDLPLFSFDYTKRNEPEVAPTSSNIPESDFSETAKKCGIIAAWVQERLVSKTPFSNQDLITKSGEVFGQTLADGGFSRKTATDAMELGINLYIFNHFKGRRDATTKEEVAEDLNFLDEISSIIPTQNVRTGEQMDLQQFSTPPSISYLTSRLAGIQKNDVMVETSAGIGSLALFALAKGATVHANEIGELRRELLKFFPFASITKENGEQAANILRIKPTLAIINPPFSASALRGVSKDSTVGMSHLDQAARLVQPGGRVVAILGVNQDPAKSMYAREMRFIKANSSIRAEFVLDGREYAKFGTTFGNRILVIDNTPGLAPFLPKDESPLTVGSALAIWEKIGYERNNAIADGSTQSLGEGQARPGQPGQSELASEGASLGGLFDRPTVPAARPVGLEHGGSQNGDDFDADRNPGVDRGNRGNLESGARSQTGNAGFGGEPSLDGRGLGASDDSNGSSNPASPVARVEIDRSVIAEVGFKDTAEAAKGEKLTEAVYDPYIPQISLVDGKMPPSDLVESAAMASVRYPIPSYRPQIPQGLISSGALSVPAMETITLAGEAHSKTLANGERRGFFLGDGTGVGKGRQVAGVIYDNLVQGRDKAIWVSETPALAKDARRDLRDVGAIDGMVFELNKIKITDSVNLPRGVCFVGYDTLKMVQQPRRKKKAKGVEETQEAETLQQSAEDETFVAATRLEQIVKWFGKDYDGVIVFDESHNAANAVAAKGKRGNTEPAKKAQAVIDLQRALPNARVMYVSATGATEVRNLAYCERLGLWGEGTCFPDRANFIAEISAGGLAAMELVARDLKAMGYYHARSLSFRGVEYERIEHKLTPEQVENYDTLARAWQMVLKNVDAALEITGASANGDAKSAAKSAFWSYNQRFFNTVITSMKMPTVIASMERDLANGHSIVAQLVNTNEASQKRALAEIADSDDEFALENLDMTPRDTLMKYVERCFPVAQFIEVMDSDGKPTFVMATDSEGNVIKNKEAEAMRDRIMTQLANIRVPDGPLEAVLNTFGVANVAEVTGRSQRVVLKDDGTGQERRVVENRTEAATLAETDDFMAGRRKVLIFSQKGGTGRSYHADMNAANQDLRRHYLLQPGWSATRATQGFGRTHRTNQKQPPTLLLTTTDIVFEARFISSIARRLDQLGALTKGQRQTGSTGLFSAKDNLESEYAVQAFQRLVQDIYGGQVKDMKFAEFESKMGFNLMDKNDGKLKNDLPSIPQFLNRGLSLEIHDQHRVFGEFMNRLEKIVEVAIENGSYDKGMETFKALSTKLVSEKVLFVHPASKAEVKGVELELEYPAEVKDWESASRNAKLGFYRNTTSGKLWAAAYSNERTNFKTGSIEDQTLLFSLVSNQYVPSYSLRDRSKWTPVGKMEAASEWNRLFQDAPKTFTDTVFMLTGTLLPVWDRVKGDARIARVQTDEGNRFIGRVLDEHQYTATLKNFGHTQTIEPSPRMVDDLLNRRIAVRFSNEWLMKGSEVAGEQRIELIGPNYRYQTELEKAGLFMEKIQWQERWFIPSSESAGVETICNLVNDARQIVEIVESKKDPRQGTTRDARIDLRENAR